jgi:hypothetical protein
MVDHQPERVEGQWVGYLLKLVHYYLVLASVKNKLFLVYLIRCNTAEKISVDRVTSTLSYLQPLSANF